MLTNALRHFPQRDNLKRKPHKYFNMCGQILQGVALQLQRKGFDYMYSILEEFAYGNISPENQYFSRGSRLGQAMSAVSGNEEKLLNRLSGEEKILFQEYIDAQSEVNQLTAVKNLVYGYKLGVLMTAETFVTGSDLIAGAEDNKMY